MDTTQVKRGDDLMLYDNQHKSIAFATSHTLTLTADVTEISCKDSGVWKDSRVNKLGWEISADHLFCDTAYDSLFEKWVAREPIAVYFGTKSTTDQAKVDGVNSPTESWDSTSEGAVLYEGKAVITNLSVNAASGDNATYSITLQGVGKFAKVAAA